MKTSIFEEKSLRILKIVTFLLLVTAFFLVIATVRIVLFPELFFAEYLIRLDVIGTFVSIATAFLSLAIYPFRSLGVQIYDRLTKRSAISFFLVVLVCVHAACGGFLLRFNDPYVPEITQSILGDNYAEGTRKLGSTDHSADKIAFLYMVNSAISQDFFSTNQSADKNLCRVYKNYFQKHNVVFATAWERYLSKYALASCYRTLGSYTEAKKMYRSAERLARWIGTEEERRVKRRLAVVLLREYQEEPKEPEVLKEVIDLLSTDSHPTTGRVLGSAYYFQGRFAEATRTWKNLLQSTSKENAYSDEYTKKIIERKMLHNNLALAYVAMEQFNLALEEIEKGISLPFNKSNQKERREQVRLMSTKALSLLANDNCLMAESTWKSRNALMREPSERCNSLILAQIHACNSNADNQKQVLEDMLVGTGQQPEKFKDYTEDAFAALVKQAEKDFSKCYLGLKFDVKSIQSALRAIVADNQ